MQEAQFGYFFLVGKKITSGVSHPLKKKAQNLATSPAKDQFFLQALRMNHSLIPAPKNAGLG